MAYGIRLGLAEPDAEDRVQEAYAILFALGPHAPVRDWFGFLVGCLQKSALDARTRARRRARLLEQQPPPVDVDPSPEDRLIARCIVEQVLGRLPPADAEPLRCQYLEDRPIREVAARLGIAEGAASMRLQRALMKARTVTSVKRTC